MRSSGLLQLASAAKYLLAPAAAGLLMPVVGVRGLVLLDASTCIVTVACTATVRRSLVRQTVPQTTSQQEPDRTSWRAGRPSSPHQACVPSWSS